MSFLVFNVCVLAVMKKTLDVRRRILKICVPESFKKKLSDFYTRRTTSDLTDQEIVGLEIDLINLINDIIKSINLTTIYFVVKLTLSQSDLYETPIALESRSLRDTVVEIYPFESWMKKIRQYETPVEKYIATDCSPKERKKYYQRACEEAKPILDFFRKLEVMYASCILPPEEPASAGAGAGEEPEA